MRVALACGVLGLVCTAVVVIAQADSVSPLLALPVLALVGIVSPARPVRAVSAAAMCAWCVLAAASVGLFLVPCALAMIVAARRTA